MTAPVAWKRMGGIRLLRQAFLLLGLMCPAITAAAFPPVLLSTNHWQMGEGEFLESVTFVVAPSITAGGTTLDDTFWLASDLVELNGHFQNDAWAFGTVIRLTGSFADHARVAGRSITVDAVVSNGLWAGGLSVATTTNSVLIGDQFFWGDTLSLLGHIDGNIYARARQITLGGSITGDVYLYGDDIVIRPGTTVIGGLHYVTTNQPIVLDANSHVSGDMRRIEEPAAIEQAWSPGTAAMLELYWFGGALLAGIPLMLLFPGPAGQSVQVLRGSLWKCGLFGLGFLIFIPFFILAAAFTIIGLPVALLLGTAYGLLLYLGKFPVALALGTALLQRRGQVSLPSAVLALVAGLFLFYGMHLVPYIGSSLQTAATAFGAGSLISILAAGRGRVRPEKAGEPSTFTS